MNLTFCGTKIIHAFVPQEIIEDTTGFTLDDLKLSDHFDFVVKEPGGKNVRFKGKTDPWRVSILRLTTKEMQEVIERASSAKEKGKLSDDEYMDTLMCSLVIGWSNGPTEYSRETAKVLLTDRTFSWFRAFVLEQAKEDKNFTRGT